VTGTLVEHEELERDIARFLGVEAALVFGSGYLANLGALTALGSEPGVIFSDERNHASLVDAARLARARVQVYRHSDVSHLRELLGRSEIEKGPRIVVTESVFSMEGDRGPLEAICDAAQGHHAWVYVDEAHGFGHLGPGGRGLAAILGGRVHAVMGTLGKAIGSYGAFVAGSAELVEYLTSTARTFLYSTALPPSVVAASRASLRVVSSEEGERLRERLSLNTSFIRSGLAAQGWHMTGVPGPILPILVPGADRALALSDRLLEKGVLVRPMRYPTVDRGEERLRIVLSAAHTEEHLGRALAAFGEVIREGA
jgi:8-amino-7-oxononanoate synthase